MIILLNADTAFLVFSYLYAWDAVSFFITHAGANEMLSEDSAYWWQFIYRWDLPPPKRNARIYKTAKRVVMKHIRKKRHCIGSRDSPGCGGFVRGALNVSQAFGDPPRCSFCTRDVFVNRTRASILLSRIKKRRSSDQKEKDRNLIHGHCKRVYNGKAFIGNWMRLSDLIGT